MEAKVLNRNCLELGFAKRREHESVVEKSKKLLLFFRLTSIKTPL